MKRLDADTKVHLAYVPEAFFINWKVLLEKIIFLLYLFGKKKKIIIIK